MNRADVPPHPEGAGSLELQCTLAGDPAAPPLLLLHGIIASSRYWLPRALPLARERRLLVPDLPGFGRSPKPFTDYTVGFFVDALAGLLARHGAAERPLDLVGHSLGGLLALELAARLAPGEVRSVVALNVPRFPDPETAHRVMLAGSMSYRRLLTMDTLGANLRQMRRAGLRGSARLVRRMPVRVLVDARRFTFRSLTSTLEHCLLHHRLEPLVERLPRDLPVLLIHGGQDQVAPLDGIVELARRHASFRLLVLPDASHNPFHTHTRRCLGAIREFMELSPTVGGPAPPPVVPLPPRP
jgi:pimeloyl-ACP methyl ester carboxylesterase